ncbi:MAG: response regulator [Lachnospiraceae bacterium]
MRIIYVDDEKNASLNFEYEMKKRTDVQICSYFSSPIEALNYAKNNDIDVAFLDIDMPMMSGIELAIELKVLHPELVIVYATAHTEYALDAYKTGGKGYLLKPYSSDDIENIFKFLQRIFNRGGINVKTIPKSRIFIKTFGRFDVLNKGLPIVFQNAKSKELFALLVDHKGGVLNNEQIFGYLWEDKEYNKITSTYVRKVIKALKEELEAANCLDFVCFNRNALNINMNLYDAGAFDCDYYRVLNKDDSYINDYNGYYMSQYSWAEETIYTLERKIKAL